MPDWMKHNLELRLLGTHTHMHTLSLSLSLSLSLLWGLWHYLTHILKLNALVTHTSLTANMVVWRGQMWGQC